MHVGAPAVERGRRAVAGDRGQFVVAECGVIGRISRRLAERAALPLVIGQSINVGDVALLAPAEFEPERVDQHQAADPPGRAHGDFERNPAAQRGADDNDLARRLIVEPIEIEIGEVVDRAKSFGPLGMAEAGMAWRRHSPVSGQPVEKGGVLRDIIAAVQE